ncbi:uncharacterized protein ARMOST_02482 [Armillaria ostoyae]|uniref:Uncharacterized protein n=1 Tax=Armillaria ostoyae TaxID=47428 RepID=A0A284QRU0_ARMOS|nr:uncharacterized protein ARMOST_02482 [Armillaria ostoyae]
MRLSLAIPISASLADESFANLFLLFVALSALAHNSEMRHTGIISLRDEMPDIACSFSGSRSLTHLPRD